MKTNKEIQVKIAELKATMSSMKKQNNKIDTITNPVGFIWYAGNVMSIEKIRHEIKLLEWVLK